jgi:hypothetical protein
MRRGILVFAISMMVAAAPLHAQGRGSSSAPKAPKTTVKSQPAKVTTPKGQSSAPKVKSTTPKVKSTTPKVKATTPKAKSTTTSTVKTTTKTTKKSTVPTTTTTSTPTGTTLTPVQQKLQKNTNLASKLRSRLPAGTDLMLAAAGFRNLGQFNAAVNASYNHQLPFAEIKTRMVDQGMSLGQAVKEVRALSSSSTTGTTTTGVKRSRG